MKKLSNITIAEFRSALKALGAVYDRTKGGHESWKKEGLNRTIVFQTHKDPIPEFVVKNALRDLGISREDFLELIEKI